MLHIIQVVSLYHSLSAPSYGLQSLHGHLCLLPGQVWQVAAEAEDTIPLHVVVLLRQDKISWEGAATGLR